MATAKDYVFVDAALSGRVYLTKRTTGSTMSKDRRLVKDNEIIGMFINYLHRFCKDNDTDTLVITDPQTDKVIFTAKLEQKEEEE